MSKLLDAATSALRLHTSARQDRMTARRLDVTPDGEPEPISPEHDAAVREGIAQLRRGEHASTEQVAAAFARFDG